MKTITQKEFDELVELHQIWLGDNTKGERLKINDCIIDCIICENKNLSCAKFNYSKFYNCIGNGEEIVSTQFGIYNVVMLKDIIAIGCEQHTVKEWLSFTDKELESMDGDKGLDWWNRYSKIVFDLHKLHFGVEQ